MIRDTCISCLYDGFMSYTVHEVKIMNAKISICFVSYLKPVSVWNRNLEVTGIDRRSMKKVSEGDMWFHPTLHIWCNHLSMPDSVEQCKKSTEHSGVSKGYDALPYESVSWNVLIIVLNGYGFIVIKIFQNIFQDDVDEKITLHFFVTNGSR